ncbi:quinone oxidoreductase family protein [Paenibacillus anseongense]|uniref:quinone oxidoreductase family protein n=1 Tax=Paenibacillus TaxID=44249 RepID=UPI002DBFA40A|nr:zinc-binding dehydrogenase [Paenibacillus anseongense]MEC0264928.1 zinc-binding dehydrogenase [Paenibacillus anseongense]
MKAIVIDRPCEAADLVVRELPELQPAPGMLTINVAYVGIGYVDVLLRRGEFGSLIPMPVVPGLEVSGYVKAIGEGVKGFYIGQPVAAMTLMEMGGYASVAQVKPELTVPLDQLGGELDMASAAAAIVNLTTAYMTIRNVARMRAGENVLVHAAAGGLGSFLGQTAKVFGAGKVFGTVGSIEKTKLATSLSYDELLIRSDFIEPINKMIGPRNVDIVLDPVGGDMRILSQKLLRPMGQIVMLGNASGTEDVPQSSNDIWLSNKSMKGFNIGAYSQSAPAEVGKSAKEALTLLAKGQIRAEIFGVFTLEKASEAHELLEEKNTVGKLLLKVGG